MEDRFLYGKRKQQRMPLLFMRSLDNGKIPALVMGKLSDCFQKKGLDRNPSSEVKLVVLS